MDAAGFFEEYFVKPQLGAGWPTYNIFNTAAYAAIGLAAAYAIFRGVRRLGLRVDQEFALAVVPFIAFGAAVRVLNDAAILPRHVSVFGQGLNPVLYPFVTPGVYVLTFAVIAVAYAIARAMGGNAVRTTANIGWLIAAAALLPLLPLLQNWSAIAMVGGLAAAALAAYWAGGKAGLYSATPFGWLVAAGQGLDGAATFVGVTFFGYGEQHVVANAVLAAGTPAAFLLLKIAFAVAVAYAAGKERDGEEKNYVMLLIAVLGFGPGLRDVLRIAAGV